MARIDRNFIPPNGKTARFLAAFLALAVWQGAAALMDNPVLLVGPVQVLERLLRLAGEKGFWSAVWFTFSRITLGFLLGFAAALLLAAAAAACPLAETLIRPYMAAVKTVPVASFVVIALLWLSSRRLGTFIAFLMVLPVLYSNFLEGIRAADGKLLEMAKVFRMPLTRRIRCIYAPAMEPYVNAACGAALGLCWKAGVAAELIGVSRGSMGGRMYEAKIYLETADLFAWTVMVVAVSVCFEKLVRGILARLFRMLEGRAWISG